MFSREYILLIGISFLIAVPIAYYSVNSWLSNFVTHISLEWWLFLIPGIIVLVVAVAVVVSKSIGAVYANPIEKLKYE